MSGLERLSTRQRELLAASIATAARTREGLEAAGLRPAEPGDVFVLEATAAWPVEWVLVDRPRPDGPFLAVPGDAHPLLGAQDLAAATSAGPLTLRTRAAVWLDPAALEADRRVALLLPEDLRRLRESVGAIARAAESHQLSLARPDDAHDYRRWLREAVEPARGAVRRATPTPSFPTLAAPRRVPVPALWKLAAAALLLVSLGLAGWAAVEARRSDRLAGRQRALERERTSREAQLARASAEIAALQRAPAPPPGREDPLLNLPVAVLLPDEALRAADAGPPVRIDGPLLVLVLKVAPAATGGSLRVELRREGSAAPVWVGDGLRRSAQGAIQLALPSRTVREGSYRIDLLRLAPGEARRLASYSLRVAR